MSNFSKEKQWMYLSGFASFCMGFYLILDILKKQKQQKTIDQQNLEQSLTPKRKNTLKFIENQFNRNQSFKLLHSNQNTPVYKICITGGPLSGITTSISYLHEKLTDMGFNVLHVPQVQILTEKSGGSINFNNQNEKTGYYSSMMKAQIQLEDYFTQIAALSGQKSIILCEKGVMDAKQNLTEQQWNIILDEMQWNEVFLRDRRYDVVIFLITAADGAENYFKEKRKMFQDSKEQIEDALMMDLQLQKIWQGHSHLIMANNTFSVFQEKIDFVFDHVCKYVGLPVNQSIGYRKLLIEKPVFPEDIEFNTFEVEEIFLKSEPDKELKIRKRGINKAFSYSRAVRLKNEKNNDFHEEKKQITANDFITLYQQRDTNLIPIKKKRRCFVWQKTYYIIDYFENLKNKKLYFLRFEGEVIPNFIDVIKDVTEEKEYNTYNLAKAYQ